jgi:tetratricopeptide (TPR) repeat protein
VDETTADARARLIDLLRPAEGAVSGDFDEALYRYSTNGVEFYNIGVAHFQKHQWDAAEKAFLRVLELKAAGLERDTRAYLIAIYREKRNIQAAIAQAEALYRADPSIREPRDLMAGEMDVARSWEALEKAARGWVELNSSDPDNWRYLALAQRNLKRPDTDIARSMLSAARAEPASVPAWLAAAEALEKAGDLKSARVAYEKVLELDQKNDKAGQAILRLNLGQLSGPSGSAAAGGASMTAPPSSGASSPVARGTAPPASGGAAPPTSGGVTSPALGETVPPASAGAAPPSSGVAAPPASGGAAPPASWASSPTVRESGSSASGGTASTTARGSGPPASGGAASATARESGPPASGGAVSPVPGGTAPPATGRAVPSPR